MARRKPEETTVAGSQRVPREAPEHPQAPDATPRLLHRLFAGQQGSDLNDLRELATLPGGKSLARPEP